MFKTAARKIAHNSTIPLGGNKDLRPLQDVINSEKSVLISLQKLSVDFSKASEALRTWGLGEGDDLGDILSASTTILTHFSSALSTYASHGHTMREHLKAIRTKEEALDDLKRRRRSVGSEADSAERKLSKMGPEHKNLATQTDTLNRLRDEIRTLDTEIMTEEAALGDFKRSTTRTWLGLKFGGLTECCEKGKIVGDYGKALILRIPEEVTQPGLPRNMYFGHQDTQSIVADVHHFISEVKLSTLPVAPPGNVPQSQLSPSSPPHSLQSQNVYQTDGLPPIPSLGGGDAWRHPEIQSSSADYLPPAPGLGTGRFLDSSSPTANSFINSSLPSASPSQSQFRQQPTPIDTNTEYSSMEPRNSLPERTMDDFGVVSSTSSRIGESAETPGGRFATFPVKGRPLGGGYTLHDDPPSLSNRQEHGKSLAETITEALEASGRGQESSTAGIAEPGRFSVDGPAPAYEPFSNIGNGPAPLPPGAAPPARSAVEMNNPWANSSQPSDTQNNRASTSTDHDALLAYMTSTDEPPRPSPGQPTHPLPAHDEHHEHHERHVRFGKVSNVDDELEKREVARQEQLQNELSREHNIDGAQGSGEAAAAVDSTAEVSDSLKQDSHSGLRSPKLDNQSKPQSPPPVQSQPQPPQQPPPAGVETSPKPPSAPSPVLSPEEEERELNAAAAREISRELDALSFNPPAISPEMNYQRHSQSELAPSQERVTGGNTEHVHNGETTSYPEREPSPLVPPTAPFALRSVSPHPYAELNPGPGPGPAPYTSTQVYGQSYQPPSPYVQTQNPSTQMYSQAYHQSSTSFGSPYDHSPTEMHTGSNPLPPRFQALNQSPVLPSAEPAQMKNPLPPRFQALNQQASAQSDNLTPQINPLPPRFQNLSQQSLSQASINDISSASNSPYRTPPEYPRSLSNSNFARSTPSLNSPVLAPAGARTISAAAFKRPQPRKASADTGSFLTTDPNGMRNRLPSSPYPQRSTTMDTFGTGSAGNGRELPAPPSPHQHPEDDEYDYISAYVSDDGGSNSQRNSYFGGAGSQQPGRGA